MKASRGEKKGRMSKVRINDLARGLEDTKSKAILDALPLVGVTEKKTHSSSLLRTTKQKKYGPTSAARLKAQSSSARSARTLRGEEMEGTPKYDLFSHISRIRRRNARGRLPRKRKQSPRRPFDRRHRPLSWRSPWLRRRSRRSPLRPPQPQASCLRRPRQSFRHLRRA